MRPNESIEKSLRILSRELRLYGRELLKEYELTKMQFIALQWVNDSESSTTIGQVANNLDLAYSTTTDIIDKLEEKGFVKRSRSEKDKRIVQVNIEEKGLVLIERVIEKRVRYIETITENFSSSEKENIVQLLVRMTKKE